MRRLLLERPPDLLLLLCRRERAGLEAWVKEMLKDMEGCTEDVARDWSLRIDGTAEKILRDSIDELAEFRRNRRYFNERLHDALGIILDAQEEHA